MKGFTLLECLIALVLVSTALVVVVESQSFAVTSSEKAARINTATTLARAIMTDLEIRMDKEGFGILEVKENGDFNDDYFGDGYDNYRWEYEVEKVELELPDMSQVMGLMGEGGSAAAEAAGVSTGGAAPSNDLSMLAGLGLDTSFLTEQLGTVLREARVRVCFPDGRDDMGLPAEDCVELISHLVNPTGQVADNTEGDDDDTGGAP